MNRSMIRYLLSKLLLNRGSSPDRSLSRRYDLSVKPAKVFVSIGEQPWPSYLGWGATW